MPMRWPKTLHACALLLILGAAVMVAADAHAAPPDSKAAWISLILHDTLAPVGLALVLIAAAFLTVRPASGPLPPDLAPIEAHRLTDSIDDVRVAIANLSLAMKTKPAAAPIPSAPLPSSDDVAQALHRIIGLFEEIRQLTLLDEKGRAARLEEQRQNHKAATLAEAITLLQARHWAKADAVLQTLEAQLPGDGDVTRARQELADRRTATEGDAISRASAAVEDLMAIGNWDQAVAAARELVHNFPDNPQAVAVEARVIRERELFEENTAHRLFEEVRQATERRQWQRALVAARQLLERFPGHRRAEKVRGQLETIQSNADIEQRQEAEAKIQDLIRSKRFVEAVAMAEQIVEKYPHSPQADSLEEMLPQMRALAIEQELDAEVR
jgi:tetratricopeptide (TPR) repeat protein